MVYAYGYFPCSAYQYCAYSTGIKKNERGKLSNEETNYHN